MGLFGYSKIKKMEINKDIIDLIKELTYVKMNFRKDERGGFFVFGPLWFVVLVVIIAIILGILGNSSKQREGMNINGRVRRPMPPPVTKDSDGNIIPVGEYKTKGMNLASTSKGLLLYNGRQCLKCNTINAKDSKFCENCGTQIIEEPL